MSEVTTGETRTCEKCSKTYQHVAWYWDEVGDQYDWNGSIQHCPSCLLFVEEREKRERLAREEEERREAKERVAKVDWEKIVPPVYRETDIGHSNYPKEIHRMAIEWQNGKGANDSNQKLFLGLIGPSCKCKSRVVAQTVKRMIWAGKKCQWVNAAKFQRLVQGQWNNDQAESSSSTVGELARRDLASFQQCDTLVLDDLGKGSLTETVAGALYDLIEERSSQGRAMLWTSNASLDDLLSMLPKDCGWPIVRRLVDFSTIIQL